MRTTGDAIMIALQSEFLLPAMITSRDVYIYSYTVHLNPSAVHAGITLITQMTAGAVRRGRGCSLGYEKSLVRPPPSPLPAARLL